MVIACGIYRYRGSRPILLSDAGIEELIAEGEIFSCAGGFKVEDKDGNLSPYIKSIDSSIDSVKGLALKLLKALMKWIYC